MYWKPCLFAGAFLLAIVCPVFAATPTNISNAERWDIFELSLQGPSAGNPFVDVRLSAVFDNGTTRVEVPGFYDGNGTYRIRFMPEEEGDYRYETRSNCSLLGGKAGMLHVTAAGKGNHGPVRVHDTYHFAYADGAAYLPVGTTIYNWTDTPDDLQEQTLKTLASSPFNKARMLLTPQKTPYENRFAPPRWPYVGTPPRDWDFTRFNPEYFQHFEKRIGELRDLGVEADVILFSPYGSWNYQNMDAQSDAVFVRYVVARLSAYRNVWWSMANEFDFVRSKTTRDWDEIGALVEAVDPYNHLRSIHNGKLIYDHTKPWVTHVSLQMGGAVEKLGLAEAYRDRYHKPIVFDEVGYEGRSPYHWGNLTAEEELNRFWCGAVAGTYVGHGDYFLVNEDTWTSFGGTLKGLSAPRIGFLRKLLEEGAPYGMNPIDPKDPGLGGRPGQFYLLYFAKDAPAAWAFHLPKEGISDHMRFKVDVIDTWAMTISPVDGSFVAKVEGDSVAEASGRTVTLPGKAWCALRIQAVRP